MVVVLSATVAALTWAWRPAAVLGVGVLAFAYMGFTDIRQPRHAILRNFPVLGRLRYFFESIRPELRQYFVESDQEENPYSREKRSIIYQRAKDVLDTVPFGTRRDVYGEGYSWLSHSLSPKHLGPEAGRIMVGDVRCSKPYNASIFNISAMSFGSLSNNAIRALNQGAKFGEFAHNTGEGGVSPYHLEPGGDLIWQIGTGYFGCRTEDGEFNPEMFKKTAQLDSVKMIEIKLSQGAKPAHGGILPAKKVTPEISKIRGVPMGKDVLSPPGHSAFTNPKELVQFVAELRKLSGGKPIGIKLCIGHPIEFLSIIKAMVEVDEGPDFITIDGGEGGTGAAPIEFSNSVGAPLREGLMFAHDALRGAGIRDDVRIFSAGKIATGFHVLHHLALGADACNSARGMMFALGCIQALKCNSNKCPAGVATQEPRLVAGLVVGDKATRVANFHNKTVEAVLELCGAAGLDSPAELRRGHINQRVSPTEIRTMAESYPQLEVGCLLNGTAPPTLARYWEIARSDCYRPGAA
ncbi:MAG: FMN-binding glutamate synthase family protein [Myxococcota bacterium]